MARVFVSYARTDRRSVEQVAQELNAAGHEAWIDVEEIQAGESWRRSIVQSIAQSDAVVVFLSPSSAASRQLATEVNLAAESGKRIFPVKIADAELSEELRYDLAGLQFIDLTTGQKDGISALLAGLGSLEIDQAGAPPTALETRRAHSIGIWWWVAVAAALLGTVILIGLVLSIARDSTAAPTTAAPTTAAPTTAAPTTNDSSTDDAERLLWEAEDTEITEPMTIHADLEASKRAYVSSPERGGPSDDLGGTASIDFAVERAGTYLVWARVASDVAKPLSSDSFFVSLDGNPEDIWDFHNPVGGTKAWEWDSISLRCVSDDGPGSSFLHYCDPWSIPLSAGRHVLTFRAREPHSRLDAIYIAEEGAPDGPPTLGQ